LAAADVAAAVSADLNTRLTFSKIYGDEFVVNLFLDEAIFVLEYICVYHSENSQPCGTWDDLEMSCLRGSTCMHVKILLLAVRIGRLLELLITVS